MHNIPIYVVLNLPLKVFCKYFQDFQWSVFHFNFLQVILMIIKTHSISTENDRPSQTCSTSTKIGRSVRHIPYPQRLIGQWDMFHLYIGWLFSKTHQLFSETHSIFIMIVCSSGLWSFVSDRRLVSALFHQN